MRSREDLHSYQRECVDFIVETPACALWLDMGLGKSVSTLTAIVDLIDRWDVGRVLIVAPLRVALTTWPAEICAWDHTRHLDFTCLAGRSANGRKLLLQNDDAQIHIINRELLPWLVDALKELKLDWPYDMVVIDEASSFKNRASKRVKALRRVRSRIDRVVELSGTPAPNGLIDLWAQMVLLDDGDRLGRTLTQYRQRYFDADYMGYNYTLREGAADQIHSAVGDIVLSMSAADHLDLPALTVVDVPLALPPKAKEQYRRLEREFLIEVEDETVTAATAGVLAGKLLQAANGALYVEDGDYGTLHDAKLDALADIIEGMNGAPLLVAINFRSDADRILERFPDAGIERLGTDPGQIDRWNAGDIPILLCHPASAGHGLNLQHGGRHLVWFGLNWSLELYDQFNARLHRQGQTGTVVMYRLIAEGTIDRVVCGVLAAKDKTQRALLNAVKADAAGRQPERGERVG